MRSDLDRAGIIELLLQHGAGVDRASMYADAFLEYREATLQISQLGLLGVKDGKPFTNPYISIRDGALKKLLTLSDIYADALWRNVEQEHGPKKSKHAKT